MAEKKEYVIYYCSHCGEKTRGKYCKTCTTADGRKNIDQQNAEIREENKKKGYKVPA